MRLISITGNPYPDQMAPKTQRKFEITVLGRTLEHLGTQMYKRRDVALAELIANSWDAGATEVHLEVPDAASYAADSSVVSVTDNGIGMSADQVDDEYLVIGRNRRAAGQPLAKDRRPMGRKGVGKLAGFGLGRTMSVLTWRDGLATEIELDGKALKAEGGESKRLEIEGSVREAAADLPFPSGTRIVMKSLKHKTPPDIDGLHRAIGRRFSRAVIGQMKITINGEDLREPEVVLSYREPIEGVESHALPDQKTVTWWAGFSETVLPTELQGFTVLVNGKTAQAPPYFFGVEATASGQHGTKYLTGVIEADFLDEGDDDESDRISTDRQEIDWEDESATSLKAWGDALTRRLLRDRTKDREKRAEETVLDDPGLSERLDALDPPSREKATMFIRSLGSADTDPQKILPLSDTIIQAFEYRQFHDYITELDEASDDPVQFANAVAYIHGWRVLESRALLEVIKGRIEIVDKFFRMIVNNAAETAHVQGQDNLHDLVARYPWLLHPDWQVLAEETTITKQLRQWGQKESPETDATRYDFLGLEGDGLTIVIEIKRSEHPAQLQDLQQLERYVNSLGQARPNVRGAFITGNSYSLSEDIMNSWKARKDIDLLTWGEIHKRTADHYEHYKAILNSDLRSDSFNRKAREVAMTRTVLSNDSSYRTPAERREGMGPQDVSYDVVIDTPESSVSEKPSDQDAPQEAEAAGTGGSDPNDAVIPTGEAHVVPPDAGAQA